MKIYVKRILPLAAILLVAARATMAQDEAIVFKRYLHTFSYIIGQTNSPEIRIPFRNCSSRAVSIKTVLTSCGCISATPDQPLYGPSKDGYLSVHVDLTEVGPDGAKYELLVNTDGVGDKPARCQLVGIGQEAVRTVPRGLIWRAAEGAGEKTAIISGLKDEKIISATCNASPKWAHVRVEPSGDGKRIALHIMPDNSSASRAGTVVVRLNLEISGSIDALVYIAVLGADPSVRQ